MEITEKAIKFKGEVEIVCRDAKTGKIKWIEKTHNMFVTAGKNNIASALAGSAVANKGKITYCAMGTGSTAPALSDTKLQTEIGRKLVSVRSSSGNVATFQTFFTTSEVVGTLREAGLFGDDATATTDSGALFCRTAINRTKSSSDTLTLTWAITIG